MSGTENNAQEQNTKFSKASIWSVIIVVGVCIAIGLCVGLQILALEHLLIFGAIFLPMAFLGRLLYGIILMFRKKEQR